MTTVTSNSIRLNPLIDWLRCILYFL